MEPDDPTNWKSANPNGKMPVKHLNDFSARTRASGYGERYRLELIKSGIEGFGKLLLKKPKEGGQSTEGEH